MAVDSRNCCGPLDARGGDGFARGDDAELGETVEQAEFLFIEMLRGGVIANLGAIGKTEQSAIDGFERRDARSVPIAGLARILARCGRAPK